MKKSEILVSIITVNYKQAMVTNELLSSLSKISWNNLEVIVVDNNSGSHDIREIHLNRSEFKLICADENLGFAGGNNLGIKHAQGQYILLLNNDTTVESGFVEPMVELLESDKTIGAVSPLIKYYNQPNTIQYAGFSKMNPLTLRMHSVGHKCVDYGQFDYARETHFAHGCAMMIPRRIIEEIGMMEEEFFLYYEEHDWSARIKKAGYRIFFQPQSVVYHKESVSTVKNSTLKTYFLNRNRILYMRRNSSKVNKIIGSLYILLISIPKNTLHFLLRSEKDHLKAYWDALIWNITRKTKPEWKL